MAWGSRLSRFAKAVKGAVIKTITNLPRPQWVADEIKEENPLLDKRDLDLIEIPKTLLTNSIRKTVDWIADKFEKEDKPEQTVPGLDDLEFEEEDWAAQEATDGEQRAEIRKRPIEPGPAIIDESVSTKEVADEIDELTEGEFVPPPGIEKDENGNYIVYTDIQLQELLDGLPDTMEVMVRVFTAVVKTDGSKLDKWKTLTPITYANIARLMWFPNWLSLTERYHIRSMEPKYYVVEVRQ